MKKEKRIGLLIAVFIPTFILALGVTIAYMFRVSPSVNQTLEKAVVNCIVEEEFNPATGVKSSVTVKNTGNIPEYLRVYLVSYWVDENGNIISKKADIPNFTLADGWIKKENNIYQYNLPIQPENSTPNLFASGQTMTLSNDTDGNRQVIEIFAEAIQTNAIDQWN